MKNLLCAQDTGQLLKIISAVKEDFDKWTLTCKFRTHSFLKLHKQKKQFTDPGEVKCISVDVFEDC